MSKHLAYKFLKCEIQSILYACMRVIKNIYSSLSILYAHQHSKRIAGLFIRADEGVLMFYVYYTGHFGCLYMSGMPVRTSSTE